MKRRSFSAEFKTKVVLEAISGEKEINQLAKEHSIAPNLIRNWKTEFLSNASSVFDTKRDVEVTEKLVITSYSIHYTKLYEPSNAFVSSLTFDATGAIPFPILPAADTAPSYNFV